MTTRAPGPRVLYSFPHKIGASRICYTAWQQVDGASAAGAAMHVQTGAVVRPLPPSVTVQTTLSAGGVSLPYRLVGQRRALQLHDRLVARRLRRLGGRVDLVHTWPLGALQTLRVARELGVPTVLERPNAHTRFAYTVVRREAERLGVELPPGHEHAYNEENLQQEEEEYALADYLLCPSDFVARTFLDEGFAPERLLRHAYGYDPAAFYPEERRSPTAGGITALFVGGAAVRKGLHYALEAWLASSASAHGRFLIAGEFVPAYRDLLAGELSHPSVEVLGHRTDVARLMRESDVFLLPTIEEGSALACAEAVGSGCVPLVSEVCTELCVHMENALVHRVGDTDALRRHLDLVDSDRELLSSLRERAISSASAATWARAGQHLVRAYRDALRVDAASELEAQRA
jgi:glycosyltransferase involved in cell wall biosynthesis